MGLLLPSGAASLYQSCFVQRRRAAADSRRQLLGSFVLSDRTVRPGKCIGRDFQTRLVRRKYSGTPNFTERGAVEGVQVDGGVAFVVREDELPLDLHADKPEVLLIPSSHNETVRVDSDTGRVE